MFPSKILLATDGSREAARAVLGDRIGFYGPGGGYAPDPAADRHLLVGDEAAIPAIAAALTGWAMLLGRRCSWRSRGQTTSCR